MCVYMYMYLLSLLCYNLIHNFDWCSKMVNWLQNLDESGLPLAPRAFKLCKKGSRSFNAVSIGDKSQITVVACVSAGGYCLPPMLIYDRTTTSRHV